MDDTALHPICLLSRTDTPTFSLYHSFFLLSIPSRVEPNVIFRVPAFRDRLDDVESAVKYFGANVDGVGDDIFGSFVITTSDGSRFYATWRGSPKFLFVAVTNIFPPLHSSELITGFNISLIIFHEENVWITYARAFKHHFANFKYSM
jgi:hypothetical protein